MTCTVTDKAGGSCQGVKPDGQRCGKILYPPRAMPHVVRGELPMPELYCDDCCSVHKGRRPLTLAALIEWLGKVDPGTLAVKGWMNERGQPTLVVIEVIKP